jgi:hypothetical protein
VPTPKTPLFILGEGLRAKTGLKLAGAKQSVLRF